MPKEVSVEELEKILLRTTAVYKKRAGENVKFKLRTKKTMFTIKVPVEQATEIENTISSRGNSIEIEDLD